MTNSSTYSAGFSFKVGDRNWGLNEKKRFYFREFQQNM